MIGGMVVVVMASRSCRSWRVRVVEGMVRYTCRNRRWRMCMVVWFLRRSLYRMRMMIVMVCCLNRPCSHWRPRFFGCRSCVVAFVVCGFVVVAVVDFSVVDVFGENVEISIFVDFVVISVSLFSLEGVDNVSLGLTW